VNVPAFIVVDIEGKPCGDNILYRQQHCTSEDKIGENRKRIVGEDALAEEPVRASRCAPAYVGVAPQHNGIPLITLRDTPHPEGPQSGHLEGRTTFPCVGSPVNHLNAVTSSGLTRSGAVQPSRSYSAMQLWAKLFQPSYWPEATAARSASMRI